MIRLTYFFLFISFITISFDLKVNTPAPKEEKATSKIRNGIEVKSNGLTVEQAFLLFEDGKLVPSDNKVEVGQWIQLRLIIKGWKVEKDRVYVGGEETVTNSEGELLFKDEELYKNDKGGMTIEEAEAITVSVRLTSITKLYDYFLVQVRVWDKKSGGDVFASYKFYLK